MSFRPHLLASLLCGVIVFPGCGYDVKPYYDENIAIKQAYTAELKQIVDLATAQAALPQLKGLSNRYVAWEQSISDVVMTVDDYDRHKDRYEPARDALSAECDRVTRLLSDDHPEIAGTIGELCQGPINH